MTTRVSLGAVARTLAPMILGAALCGPCISAPLFEGQAFQRSSGPPGVTDIEFQGAKLGMSMDAWTALPLPGGAPDTVRRTCADGASGANRPLAVKASAKVNHPITCSFERLYGHLSLPVSLTLSPDFRALDPTYQFVGGKLTRIAFSTSIDAFNQVTSSLEASYGAASQIQRDEIRSELGIRLPRVRETWRRPDGLIRITDPASAPNRLVVEFIAQLPSTSRAG
jgi:hypothetical protein